MSLNTTARRVDLDGDHALCQRVVDTLAGPEGNREVSLIFRILPECGEVASTVVNLDVFGVPA